MSFSFNHFVPAPYNKRNMYLSLSNALGGILTLKKGDVPLVVGIGGMEETSVARCFSEVFKMLQSTGKKVGCLRVDSSMNHTSHSGREPAGREGLEKDLEKMKRDIGSNKKHQNIILVWGRTALISQNVRTRYDVSIGIASSLTDGKASWVPVLHHQACGRLFSSVVNADILVQPALSGHIFLNSSCLKGRYGEQLLYSLGLDRDGWNTLWKQNDSRFTKRPSRLVNQLIQMLDGFEA